MAPGRKFSMTPYFSIIIGVTLSVLLCILLSFLKRILRSRRLRCLPFLRLPSVPIALPCSLTGSAHSTNALNLRLNARAAHASIDVGPPRLSRFPLLMGVDGAHDRCRLDASGRTTLCLTHAFDRLPQAGQGDDGDGAHACCSRDAAGRTPLCDTHAWYSPATGRTGR